MSESPCLLLYSKLWTIEGKPDHSKPYIHILHSELENKPIAKGLKWSIVRNGSEN